MRSFILTLALIIMIPVTALCQGNESMLLDHNGTQGYWFPMETGDRILKDVTELKLVREKLELIDVKLKEKDHLIELLKLDVATSEKIADKWEVAFEKQVEVTHAQQNYYEAEIESLKKWYRSPVLWFSVGVIVTGALAVGLNYGLAETRN